MEKEYHLIFVGNTQVGLIGLEEKEMTHFFLRAVLKLPFRNSMAF
jgi:hypothetical protein